jgi:glycosyltransferase involved in cell wall biosynthesis
MITAPGRRPRVLMTADAVGGVWRYSVDLARALRLRGVDTTLAVLGPAPSEAQRHEAACARIPLADVPGRLEWMDGAMDDAVQAGERLLGVASAIKPDLVHLNGYTHAPLAWKAPAIVVAHSCVRSWWRAVNGESAPPRYDRYSAAVRRGLQAAAAVVAPTHAMLRALRAEYDAPAAGEVIANGCVSPGRRSGAAGKQPLVLAAGRIWDAAKNMAALCRAAAGLTWPVCIAGETRSPDGIDGAVDHVRTLGHLSTNEMRRWYRRASIYALPARYEPFGLSVLEAARAGCALVLGDMPSLRENWDGVAVFVAPDDVEALRSSIQGLIDDTPRRHILARAAAERAAAFTIGRTADQYLRLYKRVLS